jgi:hypothetical protein
MPRPEQTVNGRRKRTYSRGFLFANILMSGAFSLIALVVGLSSEVNRFALFPAAGFAIFCAIYTAKFQSAREH